MIRFASLVAVVLALPAIGRAADPKDWPSYNGGAAGWRFNAGETASAGRPSAGSKKSGASRPKGPTSRSASSTPRRWLSTAGLFRHRHKPTFYKLAPDGKLKWSYMLAALAAGELDDRDRPVPKEGMSATGFMAPHW